MSSLGKLSKPLKLNLRSDGRKLKRFVIERLEQPVTSGKVQLKPGHEGRDIVKLTLTKKFKLAWKKLIGRKFETFDPENYSSIPEKKEDNPLENIYGMMQMLYKNGNQDMKQTIEKSWARAEEKYKNFKPA